MRILLATESYWPNISGVAIFTRQLAEHLASEGHDVAVFCSSQDNQTLIEKVNNVTIYRFASLPNPFRKNLRFVVNQDQAIRRAFHQFAPTIIHLQDPAGVSLIVRRLAVRHSLPVIATQHFSMEFILSYLRPLKLFSPLTKRPLRRYLNRHYNSCKVVSCPTVYVQRLLRAQGVRRPIRVISNGLDLERFHVNRTGQAPPLSRILYVGRIDQDKNLATLMKAIPSILEQAPAHFVFVGSGNRLAGLRRWVRRERLHSYVTLTDRVDHDDPELIEQYRQADIFVMPSTIETQSIGTMEAMAASLPVVASRAGALPELVKDNETGYLCEPNDSGDMANKIINLIQDPAKARQFGQNGQRIIQAHDGAETTRAFLELYREVLSE